MTEKTRLPRRHLRAWRGRDGYAEISVDPTDGDGITTPSDAMWEVPAAEIEAVIRTLAGVVDADALDMATTVAELRHELHVATWQREQAEKESARSYSQGVEDMRAAAMEAVDAEVPNAWHKVAYNAVRDAQVSSKSDAT